MDTVLRLTIDSRPAKQGAQEVRRSLDDIKSAAKQVTAALAVLGAGAFLNEAKNLAARYDTLGVVIRTVGQSAGYSNGFLKELQLSLQKTGISMVHSRQAIVGMIQSQLDLAHANDLARVAQNAAVTANLNSSETLARMIRAIQSGETEILKSIGLNVTWEQGYKKLANTLGKTMGDLTQQEKAQARVNTVLAAGAPIAGAYEASMDTAGKQMNSMTRYVEDLQVKLGKLFQPSYTKSVFAAAAAIKLAGDNIEILAAVGGAAAAVFAGAWLGKYVSGLMDMVRQKVLAIAATRELARQELSMAGANLRYARERVVLAAQDQLSLRERAAALNSLTAAQTRYNVAVGATTARTVALTAASRGLAAVWTALGGIVGVVSIALVAALGYFATRTKASTEAAEKYADKLEEVKKRALEAGDAIRGITEAQGDARRLTLAADLKEAQDSLKDLKKEAFDFERAGGLFRALKGDKDAERFNRELAIAADLFDRGEISARGYMKAIVETGNKFPQFAREAEKTLSVVWTLQATEEVAADLRAELWKLPDAARDAAAGVNAAGAAVERFTSGLSTQIEEQRALLAAYRRGGGTERDSFSAAAKEFDSWKEKNKEAVAATLSFSAALESSDEKIRTVAKNLLEQGRELTGVTNDLKKAEEATTEAERKRKQVLEDLKSRQQELQDATDTYYARLNDGKIANYNAVQDARAQRDAAEALLRATKRGSEAVKDHHIEQAILNLQRGREVPLTEAQVRAIREHMRATQDATDATEEEIRVLRDKQAADRERFRDEQDAMERQRREAEEAASRPFVTAIENIQRSFSDGLYNMLSGGISSFKDFANQVKDIFLRMIAEIMAANLFKKALGGALGGLLGVAGAAGAQGGSSHGAGLSGGLGVGRDALGGGLAGGLVGYGIGSMTTNRGMGALGGALGGAASGFAVGGPVGAIVGGVAGLVGGLFGSAKKAKEAARLMEEARAAFAKNAADYIAEVQGLNTQFRQSMRQNEETTKQLVAQGISGNWRNIQTSLHHFGAAGTSDESMKRQVALFSRPWEELEAEMRRGSIYVQAQIPAFKAMYDSLQPVLAASREYAEQLRTDLLRSLNEQLNALTGDDYANQVAAINRAYEENAKQIAQAELGEDALAKAREIQRLQLEQLERAETERTAQARAALDVRALEAEGRTQEAEALRAQMTQRQELYEAEARHADAAYIARLKEVHAMEEQARVARETQQRYDFDRDLELRRARLGGDPEAVRVLEMSIAHERELREAREAGATAAQLAALAEVQASESLQRAMDEFRKSAEALEDLDVRKLVALGQDDAAARRRKALDDKRELDEAIRGGASEEYIKALQEVQKIEKDNLNAILAARSAEQMVSDAATGGVGPTSVVASAGAQSVDTLIGIANTGLALDRERNAMLGMLTRAGGGSVQVVTRTAPQSGGSGGVVVQQSLNFYAPVNGTDEVRAAMKQGARDIAAELQRKVDTQRRVEGRAEVI